MHVNISLRNVQIIFLRSFAQMKKSFPLPQSFFFNYFPKKSHREGARELKNSLSCAQTHTIA